MTGERETYARELRTVLEQVIAALTGLTPAQLHWRPDTGTANSAAAIAAHVAASTRVYALGFGCGQPVTRDRAAEFAPAASVTAADLIPALRDLARELDAALAALDARALDARLTPGPELWGTGTPREITRRDALVESIRHAGVHLGELRLTTDLARRAGG